MLNRLVDLIAKSLKQENAWPLPVGCASLALVYVLGLGFLVTIPLNDVHRVPGQLNGSYIEFLAPEYWPVLAFIEDQNVLVTPLCRVDSRRTTDDAFVAALASNATINDGMLRIAAPRSFECKGTIILSLERKWSFLELFKSNY